MKTNWILVGGIAMYPGSKLAQPWQASRSNWVGAALAVIGGVAVVFGIVASWKARRKSRQQEVKE
jgi:membrane protein DedA with SNARE-associated domain